MSTSNDAGGCLLFLGLGFIVVVIYVAIMFFIYVMLPSMAIAGTAGVTWGGGQAIWNYARAVRANIRWWD